MREGELCRLYKTISITAVWMCSFLCTHTHTGRTNGVFAYHDCGSHIHVNGLMFVGFSFLSRCLVSRLSDEVEGISGSKLFHILQIEITYSQVELVHSTLHTNNQLNNFRRKFYQFFFLFWAVALCCDNQKKIINKFYLKKNIRNTI